MQAPKLDEVFPPDFDWTHEASGKRLSVSRPLFGDLVEAARRVVDAEAGADAAPPPRVAYRPGTTCQRHVCEWGGDGVPGSLTLRTTGAPDCEWASASRTLSADSLRTHGLRRRSSSSHAPPAPGASSTLSEALTWTSASPLDQAACARALEEAPTRTSSLPSLPEASPPVSPPATPRPPGDDAV